MLVVVVLLLPPVSLLLLGVICLNGALECATRQLHIA